MLQVCQWIFGACSITKCSSGYTGGVVNSWAGENERQKRHHHHHRLWKPYSTEAITQFDRSKSIWTNILIIHEASARGAAVVIISPINSIQDYMAGRNKDIRTGRIKNTGRPDQGCGPDIWTTPLWKEENIYRHLKRDNVITRNAKVRMSFYIITTVVLCELTTVVLGEFFLQCRAIVVLK